MDHVPVVTAEMLARVGGDPHGVGAIALFVGPLTGTPYKLYAVFALAAGIGLFWFLRISVPARLIRFLLVSLLASATAGTLLRRATPRTQLGLLAAFGFGRLAKQVAEPDAVLLEVRRGLRRQGAQCRR